MRREWVQALFAKLLARYGSLFSDRYAGVPQDVLMTEWASELAGYSAEEIRRGLDGCRECKFPPTLPEFMAMCRPLVDSHAAYVEAVRNMALREAGQNPEWSHPAIYWAAVDVTSFELRHHSYSSIRGRWEAALAKQMRLKAWPPIPMAYVPLPPPESKTDMPPEVRQQINDLLARMRTT